MKLNPSEPETPESKEATIAACNALLRGELSAVETYGQAIDRFKDDPEVATLIRIQSEHEQAVKHLRNLVVDLRGLPETSSGAWGAITKGIQATANLFGENSAVKSLQQGEELGQKAYGDFLEQSDVLSETKETVRNELLPMVTDHINRLESVGHSMKADG